MSHIFISYSHDDHAIANKLANDLLDKKYNVWIDNLNLPGGTKWEDDIMEGIDTCDVFLILWSPNIEGSSFSQKEKDRALAGNKKIVPLLIKGNGERIWSDISHLQYIDLRDYQAGLQKLTDDIPLPENVKPPPSINDLMQEGSATFNSALRQYRSKIDYGPRDRDAVGLLLERSEYGVQSFLVGWRSQTIKKPDAIQVFLNFSGNINQDRFGDYLEYAGETYPDNLWTVLVRGAITTSDRGLQYHLPNDSKVWHAAVQLAWRAIGKVSSAWNPLHLYMNAPVALGAGFCAMEHFRREVFIYHTNFTPKTPRDRYSLVHHFSFS